VSRLILPRSEIRRKANQLESVWARLYRAHRLSVWRDTAEDELRLLLLLLECGLDLPKRQIVNGQLRTCWEYLFVIDAGGQRESIRRPNNDSRANHYLWCGLAVGVKVGAGKCRCVVASRSNDVSDVADLPQERLSEVFPPNPPVSISTESKVTTVLSYGILLESMADRVQE